MKRPLYCQACGEAWLPGGPWCPLCGKPGQRLTAKRPKYGNQRCQVDGHTFASKKEAERYLVLKDQQNKGAIADLSLQPRLPIVVNGETVCHYVGDFAYSVAGVRIIEDVKSEITRKNPVYRLKRKLVLACHGIEILEV